MPIYENGADTKRRILRTAEQLFFEKGYEATTFSDICKKAYVNQGSIYYHFHEKKLLAMEIAQSQAEQHHKIAREFLPANSTPVMVFQLEIFTFWFRFYHDCGFQRFMSDFIPNAKEDYEKSLCDWLKKSDYIPCFEAFFGEHRLDFAMYSGLDYVLITYAHNNPTLYSWQEFAEYYLRSFMAIFRYPAHDVENTIAYTKQIAASTIFQSAVASVIQKQTFST